MKSHSNIDRPTAVSGHRLLVDAHVHLYDCFDPLEFLDAAYRNLESAARQARADPAEWSGCLCFTETARDFAFDRLAAAANIGEWSIHPTAEAETLTLRRAGHHLFIVAGHQVATVERLEVLALGTRERVPDNLSIGDTLAKVRKLGAVPIIPWAFGKWALARGRTLREIIERGTPADFAVGDNAGRPGLGLYPPLLTLARTKGYRLLSGSDPLPLPAQSRSAGTAGFVLEGWQPDRAVAGTIKTLLSANPASIRPFGEPNGLLRFVAMQAGMHLYNRMK